jgi:hypothetical protein
MLGWLQHNKEWVFSGAGVAIVTLFLSWLISKSSHIRSSHLRVNLAFGFLTFGPKLSDQMLLFTVRAIGERAVQITGLKIPLSGNRNLFFPDLAGERSVPCLLEPGLSVRFWTDLDELQATLKRSGHKGTIKIRAIVSDGRGIEYKSNRVKLDL